MRKSRTYRAKSVKNVDWKEIVKGRGRQAVHVGVDVGKRAVLAVVRWNGEAFERPWMVKNPDEICQFVGVLLEVKRGRELTVAMEPTGTYGDVLRQALFDAGIRVERVSPKVAHDYAEVFDGVPSQFDGKDAAIVAELAVLGKSQEWKYETPSVADQEMAYWVDWMDAQRRQLAMWLGRLEALLARHCITWEQRASRSSPRGCFGGDRQGAARQRRHRWQGEVDGDGGLRRDVGTGSVRPPSAVSLAPFGSVSVSIEGPGQPDSVKSPMEPI